MAIKRPPEVDRGKSVISWVALQKKTGDGLERGAVQHDYGNGTLYHYGGRGPRIAMPMAGWVY